MPDSASAHGGTPRATVRQPSGAVGDRGAVSRVVHLVAVGVHARAAVREASMGRCPHRPCRTRSAIVGATSPGSAGTCDASRWAMERPHEPTLLHALWRRTGRCVLCYVRTSGRGAVGCAAAACGGLRDSTSAPTSASDGVNASAAPCYHAGDGVDTSAASNNRATHHAATAPACAGSATCGRHTCLH